MTDPSKPGGNSIATSPRDVKAILDRYQTIGFFGGAFFGALIGVVIAGPTFHEWPWLRSVVTIVGTASLFAVAGYFGGALAVGGVIAGPGSGAESDAATSDGGDGGGDS